MAAAEANWRVVIARRAAALTGVEPDAILAEIAPDGLSHHAASAQVGAAIDQAIAEVDHAPDDDAP